MLAGISINPKRICIPKYGNGLMLLMEYAGRENSDILGKVVELDEYFEIEIKMSRLSIQKIKEYINNNL